MVTYGLESNEIVDATIRMVRTTCFENKLAVSLAEMIAVKEHDM